jgi:hypothetical protein
LEVGAKPGNFAKAMEDCLKVLDIMFEGSHKDRCVVRIKRSSEHIAPSPNLVKEAMCGCNFQNLRKRINSKDEE